MAANFSGFVSRGEKTKILVNLSTLNKKVLLATNNPEIQAQLSRLKSNDFISIDGYLDDEKTSLVINSINYVGLKDLVGNWMGDDDYCYKFKDFYTMSIYNKNEKGKCVFATAGLAREFSYFANPTRDAWSLLLSDNDDSYLMDLTLKSKSSAELSLYDSKSGDIIRQIKMKR